MIVRLFLLGLVPFLWSHTFPVEEESLLALFQKESAKCDWGRYIEEAKAYVLRPTPIEGLCKAEGKRVFYFDPSKVIEENIVLPTGVVLAEKGERINPLEKISMDGGYLFFDGDDEAQVAWSRTFDDSFRRILVKGSPIELEEQEGRSIYFDQMQFARRLNICNVPAVVTQEGLQLRIEEGI